MLDRTNVKFFKMALSDAYIKHENDVDITVRCPICGDSQKNKRMARLHLYHKNGVDLVHCFNSGCLLSESNRTVYSFLRDCYPSFLGQYKRETFQNNISNLSNGDIDVFSNIKKVEKKPDETKILYHDLTGLFKPITDSPSGIEYLNNRLCSYNEDHYGKWYFSEVDLKIGEKIYKTNNSIIIPLYHNEKMYGFYSRSINSKMFATYNPEQNMGYKVWNWFNVDKNRTVYVFEGIFDAISSGLDNVIALMGAKLPDERLKELKDPVFVLDNDKTGWRNTLNYVSNNHKVYIQPEKYPNKDMNDLKKNQPDLDIPKMIKDNIFQGIMGEIRIKEKM